MDCLRAEPNSYDSLSDLVLERLPPVALVYVDSKKPSEPYQIFLACNQGIVTK